MRRVGVIVALGALLGMLGGVVTASPALARGDGSPVFRSVPRAFSATPVLYWSNEARRAIVPPSAGPENFGNKFPGEAAVYMGIVHVAIYDAAVAIEGGYRPYAIALTAPAGTSPAAAIAAAAHDTLIGLQPALGLDWAQRAILDGDYAAYLAAIPGGAAKTNGITIGKQVAAAVLALRANDGRDKTPRSPTSTRPRPAPASGSPTPPGRCWACACPGSGRSRSPAPRSSGPTARTP